MVVDITSVSVLENMYNILTQLKNNRDGFLLFVFPKVGKRGQQSDVLKNTYSL